MPVRLVTSREKQVQRIHSSSTNFAVIVFPPSKKTRTSVVHEHISEN